MLLYIHKNKRLVCVVKSKSVENEEINNNSKTTNKSK